VVIWKAVHVFSSCTFRGVNVGRWATLKDTFAGTGFFGTPRWMLTCGVNPLN